MREHICPRCSGTGKIHKQKKGKEPIPLEIRFWEKVDKRSPEECWNWKNYIGPNGYGQFSNYRDNKNVTAHRVAYEITTGEILTDLDFICHKCNNRSCCNPNHLYKGNAFTNSKDTMSFGNWKKPPIISGWDSPNVKITRELALEIRLKAEAGEKAARLAKEYNVGRTTVGRILHREGIFRDL